MYDSAALYPLGKCHPGTRKTIIKTILDWVNDPASSSDVLWLCGPAGSGKSAIMHTIAEKLHELHNERYGGSFFFARGVPGRDQATALFATLAYQLAMNFPSLRSPINHAMATDPILPSKSMEVQFKLLLVEPLTSCSDTPSFPPTMIIDGLDECGNSRTQRQILATIANAIAVAHVPLRFLIASRPEYWLRDTFDHLPLLNITQQINLSDSEHASDSFEDIEKYLQDGFDDIYEKNQDIMGHVKRPWPSEDLLCLFAYHASGQFIFASVVLKFVDDESDDFSNPQDKLDILTGPGSLQASAFSELDQLYMRILSAYRKRDTLIQVLGGLLECPRPKFVGVSLGIDTAELNLALRAISSLIRTDNTMADLDEDLDELYGPPKDRIQFCHLSFREFLEDKARSGPFWIDIEAVGNDISLFLQDMYIGSLNGTWSNQ
ncbi:hypothetical protein GALMADRAFT_131044 [Galerina marginata CBS 339.88]|uniref:NACHT domain-containing protein n=1 Tax=Galerina marginata (strain CBS 339.88) TaxID=685588 RepID=A0A067S8Z3_GALM3|nr:hypothetical protein GALMADRAFT_131044 [Galerina marginata CBS 339.88]